MSIQSRSHQYGTVFENWQILELLGQGSGGKTAVFRLKRIDSNIQRYIRLNITEDFSFRFHQVSVFNKDEYLTQLKDQATLGIPVKMDYATAGGKSPLDVMNDGFMENALGLTDIWKPLSSSYTQSGKESGGQTKKDDELSDSAISTRDAGKNEGTKAGK